MFFKSKRQRDAERREKRIAEFLADRVSSYRTHYSVRARFLFDDAFMHLHSDAIEVVKERDRAEKQKMLDMSFAEAFARHMDGKKPWVDPSLSPRYEKIIYMGLVSDGQKYFKFARGGSDGVVHIAFAKGIDPVEVMASTEAGKTLHAFLTKLQKGIWLDFPYYRFWYSNSTDDAYLSSKELGKVFVQLDFKFYPDAFELGGGSFYRCPSAFWDHYGY